MNDFPELENELRKLKPAQPSSVLFERVGEALEEGRAPAAVDATRKRWRLVQWSRRLASGVDGQLVRTREQGGARQTPHNGWWSLGFGLAAAAVLVLFALVTMERRQEHQQTLAQSSRLPEERSVSPLPESSRSHSGFVPVGGTNLVYNARDEGLHFANGSERPVRRVRYNTQQTWRWRNPETGASLRVSYPSEEVVLIPVSVQ